MRLIAFLLIPAMLMSQTADVRKMKLGNAELTLAGGSKKTGRIVRVTDEFVSLQGSGACEDIEYSKIVKVRRLRTPREHGYGVQDYIGVVFFLSFVTPIEAGYWVVGELKPPPLKPLRGTWESGGNVEGRLDFQGLAVKGNLTIVRHGRYSVAPDGLHLAFEHTPETVIPFVVHCTQLALDSPVGALELQGTSRHVSAPIVGEWRGRFYTLIFKTDGRVEERKDEMRNGTFEPTAIGVRIHWGDSEGFGGQEWNGKIGHRHIVFRIGSVVTKFSYVIPGSDIDM
jgi:hypothetical protein